METSVEKRNRQVPFKVVVVAIAIAAIAGVFLFRAILTPPESKTEVITVSTLKKIINVSEFSTFTAVYNGIAQVMNEKKSDEIDYYVSYDAKVDAGIDFKQLVITVDNKTKIINISIPEVYITDVNVDIGSLDFIFCNQKANTSTVTQAAFTACESDVQRESEQQTAIFELATQNAVNVLTALTKPIIEQLDADYTLVIEKGEQQ